MNLTVAEIAQQIGAEVVGDTGIEISGLGSLGTATTGELSHLSSPSYRQLLASTQASAVILSAEDAKACNVTALIVENPYQGFAQASQLFFVADRLDTGIHESAVVGRGCDIHSSVAIGAHVVIGEDTRIGEGVRIFANAIVGERCSLDDEVTLHANVTLYSDVHMGARSVVHSSAVIGAPGFGFSPDAKGHWQEIVQLGGVDIGADVSIGACTTIDCGAIDDTVVEEGVKIDNQVQIGHNCRIGAHTLLCGCVGIAGSSVIGKHCVFAGRSGVGGDKPITVCDGVTVTACTFLSQSVTEPGVYSGAIIFHEHNTWRRNAVRFMKLNDLFKRVKRLEDRDK